MFGTSRASSDASQQTPVKRRRDGRGLGPFSSGHLTVIVVTLVIVVAFPFAAFAVTGNNVFVTDFTSGAPAKVDSAGSVQTKVSSGSIFATPTAPSQQYVSTVTFSDVGPKCKTLVTPP